ncbi:S1 family peptidase [Nocardioides sp. LML1-1-1.1]|uniref:S1 family peptidase n=1 Tax=Nocardioides sp. LML1-1-1.1 TaxID=3135248 RepID=UPI00341A97E4
MKTRTTLASTAALSAVGALLLTGAAGTSTATASVDVAAPVARHDGAAPVAQQAVSTRYSADVVALMARTSGRTVAEQQARLQRQDRANNTAARLQAAGHHFDGLFLDAKGDLVVQAAPGSASAAAAKAAGATVRDPAYGQARLSAIQASLSRQSLQGVAKIGVDLEHDRVVVTRSGALAPALDKAIRAQGGAVVVRQGAAYETQATVKGGDKITIDGGGYCSAGFPGHDGNGALVMVWVGHCVEGASSFEKSGTRIGTYGDGDFVSYDGRDDYDTGYVRIDAEDSISVTANQYGTTYDLDASRGSAKPPVGTEVCRTGATSGITCGEITSYDNTVTYVDKQRRTVAVVRGLAETSACTSEGDSGGAYSAGGYGVGLTSGGPTGQTCGWNGGFQSGKSSLVQPVNDVLSRYGLTYN